MFVLMMEKDNGMELRASDFFDKGIQGDYVILEFVEGAEEYLDEVDWEYAGWSYITEGAEEYEYLSAGKVYHDLDGNLEVA